jgi:DNA-binding LacI/PurR family transcriptional regulator
MADIARLAGVSVSTVSRALAGSALVNEATRTRVAELARSLNYTINVGAQNLRLKQNRTIAVNVPYDPATRQHLSDPFFLSLIGSLADALTDRGYEMLLSRVDAERLDLAAQSYLTGRAAGIVLVGQWHHHDQLNEMALRGVPFVVWGAQLPGQRYATVGSDNQQGGRLATAHLLAQGAKQVAFLGDPELPEVGLRHQGYLQALREAGLAVNPALCRPAPFVREEIEREVEALCQQGVAFDGLFAASDLMAMTAISTLRRLGRQVPENVIVAGYDDIELAAHFHPALTTVRQPIAAAGEQLVSSLLLQLDGQQPQPCLLPTDLVARESSQRR